MQLRLIVVLGADRTNNNRKGCTCWKGGNKVHRCRVQSQRGVREEKCNYPEDVNLVAMPERCYFI